MDSAPEKGTLVRFTHKLGAVDMLDRAHFVADVEPGDEGVFQGPHPAPNLRDEGWVVVEVTKADALAGAERTLYVPCGLGHFHVVTDRPTYTKAMYEQDRSARAKRS